MARVSSLLLVLLLASAAWATYTVDGESYYYRVKCEITDPCIPGNITNALIYIPLRDISEFTTFDADSVRVTSSDGTTVLDFWMDEWTDDGAVDANIWTTDALTDGDSDYVYVYAADDAGIADGDDAAGMCTTLGIVAFWPFYNGAGTEVTDVSGNGYDGTIYDLSWTSTSRGSAVQGDGVNSHDIRLSDTSYCQATGDFTVLSWYYADVVGDTQCVIASKNTGAGGTQEGYALYINSTNRVSVAIDNGAGTYSAFDSGAGATVTEDAWSLVGMTWDDGVELAVWIDGVNPASDTTNLPSGDLSSGLVVRLMGFANGGYTSHCAQKETWFFNRVLSDDEMVWYYTNQSAADGAINYTVENSPAPGGGAAQFIIIQQ